MEQTIVGSSRVKLVAGRIALVEGEASVPELTVGAEVIEVGRGAGCSVVVLGDARVSGLHFSLSANEAGVRIRDLGSKNGTFVNGVRVRDADLPSGAEIRCGDTVFEFRTGRSREVKVASADNLGDLVGNTPAMRQLFARCALAARTNLSVLLLGETGVGKEVFAQAIHAESGRTGRLEVIDCSSIPASLIESHLFGHVKGAFTGASSERRSPFVEANGGTVFLDELAELPLDLQTRLLRVLAEQKIRPVGGSREIPINVRIIAATRRSIVEEVNARRFRDDLYFRLAQVKLTIPPLRERLPDVPLIIEAVLERRCGRRNGSYRFARGSLERAMSYDWPGNVRELVNVVDVAHNFAKGDVIDLSQAIAQNDDFGRHDPVSDPSAPSGPYWPLRNEFERAYWEKLWDLEGQNISEIARVSGRDRKNVKRILRSLGLLATPRPTRRTATRRAT